jgi:hypothetical protein
LFNLSEIAAIGSISILFVHTVTHLGHLKIITKTGASIMLVLLAALLCLGAMILALVYVFRQSGHVVGILGGFVFVAAITECSLQKITSRKIKPRIQQASRGI